MADKFKACLIDGCKRNADATAKGSRGWCQAHYQRWLKYGSPLAGGPPPKVKTPPGEARRFLDSALQYDGDECQIWPFTQVGQGYGQIKIAGVKRRINRFVCEQVHGRPPSEDYHAAHSCGNSSCITPRHLSWKTQFDNELDKLQHGTMAARERHGMAKLTEEAVSEIRTNSSYLSQRALARLFGVHQATIHRIQSGKSWQ